MHLSLAAVRLVDYPRACVPPNRGTKLGKYHYLTHVSPRQIYAQWNDHDVVSHHIENIFGSNFFKKLQRTTGLLQLQRCTHVSATRALNRCIMFFVTFCIGKRPLSCLFTCKMTAFHRKISSTPLAAQTTKKMVPLESYGPKSSFPHSLTGGG